MMQTRAPPYYDDRLEVQWMTMNIKTRRFPSFRRASFIMRTYGSLTTEDTQDAPSLSFLT